MKIAVKDAVKEFLTTNPVYSGSLPEELGAEFPLIDSGVLDSIGLFTLIVHLEKLYGIDIELPDLNETNFGTLETIQKFVESKAARS